MKKTPIIAFGIAVFPAFGSSAQAPGADIHISSQATFRVEQVTEGLREPWGMAFLPDGGVLVTERPGRLRLVNDNEWEPESIEGVPIVFDKGQGGLLDVALDPAFSENNLVYLSYAGIDNDRRSSTRVARGRLVDGRLADVEVIFRSNSASLEGKHWGSRLGFDPTGDLYVTIGDRGEPDSAQDLRSHGGTVVRIEADGSVPDDNPFIDQADVLPEIFSYGHRNPQGLAVHPETGQVWTQEHGPQGGDEVNLMVSGTNYGWPEITFGINYDGSLINGGLREQDGMAQPKYFWAPSIAPSGMTFYDGDVFPDWQGDLFIGALKDQLIARLELDGDTIIGEERLLEDELGRIRDVRTGPDGFIYILTDDADGGLYRLVPAE